MASDREATKECGPEQITAADSTDENQGAAIARGALNPAVQAAFTLRECGGLHRRADLPGLVDGLTEQTRKSSEGDLKRAEAMLTAQAHILDAIFNRLAQIAMNAEYLDTADRYLKLALRAQSQCRATWEALSAIQNPPMAGYVAQANVAHNQQVNNGTSTSTRARTREHGNPPNKLLEQSEHEADEWMDGPKARAAARADSALETVGKIDGAKDEGRQG